MTDNKNKKGARNRNQVAGGESYEAWNDELVNLFITFFKFNYEVQVTRTLLLTNGNLDGYSR